VEFPSTHKVSLRTLAFWGYVLLFGALWGYATVGYTHTNLDGSTDSGLLFVWVVIGFVGSTLVGLKNRRIQNRRMRTRITLGDGAVILGSLVLVAVLPGFIGMVKGLVLLALFTPYYYKTWHIYQAT
jgi:L-asparagine transporter-like permease